MLQMQFIISLGQTWPRIVPKRNSGQESDIFAMEEGPQQAGLRNAHAIRSVGFLITPACGSNDLDSDPSVCVS